MYRMGRKPRTFLATVPHYSALIAGQKLPPPPASVDYLANMPANLGMFLNDSLGCCTCAAVYHALQVWSFTTGTMQTNPDSDVLAIYEQFCGYVQGDPSTDQGGIEQTVLADWMQQGIPTLSGPNHLAAWIEVDPRNHTDVKRVIDECGVCYIGFEVPSNILPQDGSPPPRLWSYQPGSRIEGGHAVVLAGYNDTEVTLISWGQKFAMTWEFFSAYVDETYALVNATWAKTTGKTPLDMSLDALVAEMDAMKQQ